MAFQERNTTRSGGRLYSSFVQTTIHNIITSTRFENLMFDVNSQSLSVPPLPLGSKSFGLRSFRLLPSSSSRAIILVPDYLHLSPLLFIPELWDLGRRSKLRSDRRHQTGVSTPVSDLSRLLDVRSASGCEEKSPHAPRSDVTC